MSHRSSPNESWVTIVARVTILGRRSLLHDRIMRSHHLWSPYYKFLLEKYHIVIQKSVSFLAADISFFQVQKRIIFRWSSAIATTTTKTHTEYLTAKNLFTVNILFLGYFWARRTSSGSPKTKPSFIYSCPLIQVASYLYSTMWRIYRGWSISHPQCTHSKV